MIVTSHKPLLTWKPVNEVLKPCRENYLVYRDPNATFLYPETKEQKPERRRGVDGYDIDQYIGLNENPWAFQAGSAVGHPYSHYCKLPVHPQWNAEKIAPDNLQTCVVLITEGAHQGEFLSFVIEVEEKEFRRMLFLGKGYNDGWSSMQRSEKLVRCWLPVPDPPTPDQLISRGTLPL